MNNTQENFRMLSIDEAATLLSISPQTLRNWEAEDIIVPARTEGGHRRYKEQDIIELRKKRMGNQEIIIPNIQVKTLIDIFKQLVSNFDVEEKVCVVVEVDHLDSKVIIDINSKDGLTTVSKSFKMLEKQMK
jgi:DNA-binding transcriptional MerR regulator